MGLCRRGVLLRTVDGRFGSGGLPETRQKERAGGGLALPPPTKARLGRGLLAGSGRQSSRDSTSTPAHPRRVSWSLTLARRGRAERGPARAETPGRPRRRVALPPLQPGSVARTARRKMLPGGESGLLRTRAEEGVQVRQRPGGLLAQQGGEPQNKLGGAPQLFRMHHLQAKWGGGPGAPLPSSLLLNWMCPLDPWEEGREAPIITCTPGCLLRFVHPACRRCWPPAGWSVLLVLCCFAPGRIGCGAEWLA
ncbi:hypothetical protein E2320_017938 [Naja naja]|nr:hypothetical protein E2320_017938 [Naja naja]